MFQIVSTAIKLEKTLSPTHLKQKRNLIDISVQLPNKEEKLIKSKHQYSKHLKNPNDNSFFITPTKNEEVLSGIKNLKNNKSSGPSSLLNYKLSIINTVLQH